MRQGCNNRNMVIMRDYRRAEQDRGQSPLESAQNNELQDREERGESRKGSRRDSATQQVDRHRGLLWVGTRPHRSQVLFNWGSLSFCLGSWSSWVSQGPRLCDRSNLCRYNYRRFSQPQTTIPSFYTVKCRLEGKNLSFLVTPCGA